MIKRAFGFLVLSALIAGYQPAARAQISTTVQVCGTVTVYVAATQVGVGAITIGGVPYVIAAGTALQGAENIHIGAEMCLTATLNASLQITNGSIVANVESTIHVCGEVSVFVAATQSAAGAITIGGVPYVIAAGTVLDGQENVQIGLRMCLTATVNALAQIVAPSSIVADVSSTIDICGEVTAYVAATSAATGDLAIDGVHHTIAAGVQLENAALIRVGVELCLHATVNVIGEITAGSVTPPGGDNHAPAINAPSSASVAVGDSLHFSVVASDQDAGDSVTLTGSGLPAGATLSPNPATGNPATAEFNFTPTASQAGHTFTVTFSASDNHGANASATCQITVTQGGGGDTNHAPTISVPGPQTVAVGQTLTFVVTADDPDGDDVTLSASNLPAGATFDPASGTFTFTPTAEQGGQTFTVVFTATDTHNASVSDTVTITVTGGGGGDNHVPTISVPGPQTIAVGQTLTFTVVADDPDGDDVTLSATGVPPNASFDPTTGVFTFTPTAEQVGQTFTVVFTATDDNGGSASASVAITVTESGGGGGNAPPIISVPPSPITVAVDDTLTFTVTATTGISNCHVRLSARSVPEHASFAPGTGEFRFTPVASQANQSYTVTFRATDCLGQTSTATVTIVVTSAGGGGGGGGDNGSPCMSVTQVTFSPASVGSSCGFAVVTMTNEGTGTLTVTGLELADGTQFRFEGVSAPMQLQPGTVVQIRIVFAPTAPGLHRDRLRIIMGDGRRAAEITLKGKALRR
jgi:hypothetical protein